MTKLKRTNNDLQNTTWKLKIEQLEPCEIFSFPYEYFRIIVR
jgi:hypothetical protein